jgi:hypothetical protein
MVQLLSVDDLPGNFNYPWSFVRAIEHGLTQLEPWWILEGKLLLDRLNGIRERYPGRSLVPFAVRQDRDDVACFDVDSGRVVIIHDFAKPGWEQRSEFDDFNGWLRHAIEDFIEFGDL